MNCIKCGQPIPEGRIKILPNTKTCVKHSDSEKKVGIPVSYGSGEDILVELNILEAKDFKRFEEKSHTTRSNNF